MTPRLGAELEARGVLDLERLRRDAVLRLHLVDGPEQVAGDVDRVGAVVDEHAAARHLARAFQRSFIIDLAAEACSRTARRGRGCPPR